MPSRERRSIPAASHEVPPDCIRPCGDRSCRGVDAAGRRRPRRTRRQCASPRGNGGHGPADLRRPPHPHGRAHLRPDTMVPVSKRAAEQRSGSAIGLEVGERWRADDLLNALILASANDAAVALAEAVAGSVERFADLMNQKARAIGARNSTFVVPHGLYYPQHLTTARDLALITRYALRHPAFAALVRQQTFTWMRHGLPPRVVVNRNRLLWRLPGADGVKTGWIPESGQCLVASATRRGWQLIAVALDSPDVFADATRLLEYGFSHFRLVRVAAREVVLARRPLPRAAPDARKRCR